MTKSETKKGKQAKLPTANATIIGENPCLYPLVLPGEKGATTFGVQKCQNLLFLQNYLASQYLLDKSIVNGFANKQETRMAALNSRVPLEESCNASRNIKPKSKKVKKTSACEKEDDAKKQEKKRVKKKKRPAQLKEPKKENSSKNKRQKTSGDQPGKKCNKLKKSPRSPASVTPRRKAPSDLMGFVSLNLPVPRDITAEWQKFKKEIITPPWQPKRYKEKDNDEESSSEEDISEETYFRWHTRSFERDCLRIRKVLENKPPKNRSLNKAVRNPGNKAKAKPMHPEKQLLSQPMTYNYDVFTPRWSTPKEYIRFVDKDADAKVSPKPETEVQAQPPKINGRQSAGKQRKKKRRAPTTKEDPKALRTTSNEEDLAEMKLRYLELQAQLEKLCGKKRVNSVELSSRSTWKAEKKKGKDGKETNVIRLLRVSKRESAA